MMQSLRQVLVLIFFLMTQTNNIYLHYDSFTFPPLTFKQPMERSIEPQCPSSDLDTRCPPAATCLFIDLNFNRVRFHRRVSCQLALGGP